MHLLRSSVLCAGSRPFSPLLFRSASPLLFRSASPIHRNDTVRSSPALPGTTRHDTMHFTRYPSIYYTTPPHIPTPRTRVSFIGLRRSDLLFLVFCLFPFSTPQRGAFYALCLMSCHMPYSHLPPNHLNTKKSVRAIPTHAHTHAYTHPICFFPMHLYRYLYLYLHDPSPSVIFLSFPIPLTRGGAGWRHVFPFVPILGF